MVQLLDTSVSRSDTVVAEEVSMAACSIPKSSRPLSSRPCVRACASVVHANLTLDVLVQTLKVGCLTVVLQWEPILKPKMPNSI